MNLSVAGIDLDSFGVHIVRLPLRGDHATYNRIRVDNAPGDAHARVRRLRGLMPGLEAWARHGVIHIAIEEPMTSPKRGGFKSIVPQAVMRGALLACLPADVDLKFYKPFEWKKWSLGGGQPGMGNASKEQVREWVLRRWLNRPEHAGQDAFDAFAVAWAARRLLDIQVEEGARAA